MMIPKPLFPGARVALVAPASAVPEEKLQPALDYVQALGLEPVVYPSCYFKNRDGYLAACDAQRAKDINKATVMNLAALAQTLGCKVEDLLEQSLEEVENVE